MVRRPAALLAAVVLVSIAAGVVAGVEGSPELSVHLPDNRVEVGAETTLEFYLLNVGEVSTGGPADEEARVTTARNVTLTVEAGDAPVDVRTTTRPVGNVPEGVAGPVTVAVVVDETAEPGTYALPVTVEYRYTSEIDDDGDPETESESEDRTVDLVVEPAADFAVDAVSTDLAVGETGPIELRLRNAGGAAARAATVTVRADDPALTFGGGPTASVHVGDWAAGENRTVTVAATLASGADVREYPLSVSVAYRDEDGIARNASPVTAGAVPRAEQAFQLADVTGTLAVGDEGTLRGTVTNTGPTTARNAVVVFTAGNASVVPVEREYAIGDLGPGETAPFTFDAEVADSAAAGPRQLSFVVRYRDAGDDVRRSDPLDARVAVGPRRPAFAIEPVQATIAAGERGLLELQVTNARDEPVSDVSAKLFTEGPLSSSDDEAFIDGLAPGESATVRFALSADGDALDKRYPVSLDFQYDDADGDTRLSDTYRVAVRVTGDQDGAIPIAVIAGAAVVVVLAAGGLWYRRG